MTDLPSVETICRALAAEREKGTLTNPHIFSMDNGVQSLAYSPPGITVTVMMEVWHEGRMTNSSDECVAMKYPWDHTLWSLQEAVEAARKGGGKVYIEQDVVYTGTLEGKEDQGTPEWTKWVDEGFEFEIWPNWTGRHKYTDREEE